MHHMSFLRFISDRPIQTVAVRYVGV